MSRSLEALENEKLIIRVPFSKSFDGPMQLLQSQISKESCDDERKIVQAYQEQVMQLKEISKDK